VTPLPKKEEKPMAKKREIPGQIRIKAEEERLRRIYRDIDEDNKAIIDGLIQRAAYMRVTLEDWETDIIENGYIEMFTQSERTPPYERERPVVRLYNTLNKNYQSIIKQLSDLVPKPEAREEVDVLDEFVLSRNE